LEIKITTENHEIMTYLKLLKTEIESKGEIPEDVKADIIVDAVEQIWEEKDEYFRA
tara:strand:+ start:1262 stop:1429 length:168 start_codon:yes stop_codon:yes gene_type:complete